MRKKMLGKMALLLSIFCLFSALGCASAQFTEEFGEALENPLPYRVAMAPVILDYLGGKKNTLSSTRAPKNSKAPQKKSKGGSFSKKAKASSPKQKFRPILNPTSFRKDLFKQFSEHKIFSNLILLDTAKVRSTPAKPMTVLNSASLQDLLDNAKSREAQMLMLVTIDDHKVSYNGFNNMWWVSLNAWWFLWIGNWFVADEDFTVNLEITVDLYSVESRSVIYSESFNAQVRHSLSDWTTRLGMWDALGVSLLFRPKKYSSQVFKKVQQKFMEEIQKKLYYDMVRTFIRKFVPYSRTSKFLSDLNGVGFPPTIKIDLQENQKFDLQTAKVNVSLGDDRGIKEVRFKLYSTPSADKKTWKNLPAAIQVNIKDKKIRFRRYQLELRFPEKGKYLLEVKCDDEDKNNARWTYRLEYSEIKRQMIAVVIGVGKFARGNIPPLRYAAKDATDLANFLKSHRKALNLKKIISLTQEKATSEEIRHQLGTVLAREATAYDTVLIFYSGHGVAVPDPSSPDKDKREKYFVPYDADRDSWYSSAIPMGELQMILDRIDSRRVLVFLDSCYSGSGAKSLSGADVRISADFQNRFKRRGLLVMTASDTNQYSYESEKLSNGYFTYYLIQGLSGKADANKNGEVTVSELMNYIQNTVQERVQQDEHQIQTPTISNKLYGDFALVKLTQKEPVKKQTSKKKTPKKTKKKPK